MSRSARLTISNSRNRSSDRTFHSFVSTFLGGCLAFILFCAPAAGAQVSAAISGRVTDPAGATVSGAAVAAKNVETGAVRATVTDDAGRYSILSVAVGEYEVRVSKQSFQEGVRSGIHLAVGQEAIVDVGLQLGQITE